MSEPIQSISQGNYILHNIDAKKLYVQEPLFTANSGDAVYVGWRPDETVLFEYTGEGKNTATAFDISEPLTNFETIRIRGVGYPGNDGQLVYCDVPSPRTTTENFSICTTYYCSKNDGNPLQVIGQRYSASNNGLTYSLIDKKMLYYPLKGITPTNTNANMLSIDKVIGINRKENA